MNSLETKPTKKKQRHLEYRYDMSVEHKSVHVAVNSANSYCTTILFATELLEAMKAAIPFPCNVSSEPEVHILGGMTRKGMLSVEMIITFELSNDEAESRLEEVGFVTPTELILG
jgi:hypothetical protein